MRIPRRLTRLRAVVSVLVVALLVAAVTGLVPADVAAAGVFGLPVLAGLHELGRAQSRLRRVAADRNRVALAERAAILAEFRAVADRLEGVEQNQRRLLAAVETERLAGADRHRRLLTWRSLVDDRESAHP